MSHDGQADEIPAEQRVARLFEAAGYEVAQAVGVEPGTVDWYATPRAGLVRPRTYWLVWERSPADPEAAMMALEQARIARNADRALAILITGRLPEGYETDLHGRTSNMVTYRRLALEISGIADEVRDQVKRYERDYGDAYYLSRTARTRTGAVVDAVDYIKEWAQSDRDGDLVVMGSKFSGRSTVIERARYEIGLQFIFDPENTRPISDFSSGAVAKEAIQVYFALFVKSSPFLWESALGRGIYEADLDDKERRPETSDTIELRPPSSSNVEQWFQHRLPKGPITSGSWRPERLAISVACRTRQPTWFRWLEPSLILKRRQPASAFQNGSYKSWSATCPPCSRGQSTEYEHPMM